MTDRVPALLAAHRREQRLRRLFTWAARLASLTFAVLYLYFLMGLGRDDVFYLLLTLGSLLSGLSGLVVIAYFQLPGLVRALHDPARAAAAAAAIASIRAELLPRLFHDLGEPVDLDVSPEALVRLSAPRLATFWRRFAPLYLVLLLAALAAILAAVFSYAPPPLR